MGRGVYSPVHRDTTKMQNAGRGEVNIQTIPQIAQEWTEQPTVKGITKQTPTINNKILQNRTATIVGSPLPRHR